MIIITGYMASGKTVIGKRLAAYLQLPFYDLDRCIEEESGMSVSEIFRQSGEQQFRTLEHDMLIRLLNKIPHQSVLSVGGGTPCFHDNMEILKSKGLTVYIEVAPNEIIRHLKKNPAEQRPLVAKHDLLTLSNLRRHLGERVPFYALSHIKIPLKLAKNPELLTKALILFTTTSQRLNYLHEFP